MREFPFYKSIKFYLLLFSVILALIFLGIMLLFVAGAFSNKVVLFFSLSGFLVVWLNTYFITSRFDKELTLLQESIRTVVLNKFSRKFKLKTIPIDDEIGQISKEVGLILDKAHQRTTEVLLRRKEIELAYRNMEQLAQIGRDITSSLDVNTIIHTAFKNINTMLDASLLAIGIYNTSKNGLDFFGIRAGSDEIIHGYDDMTDNNHWSVHCFLAQEEILCNEFNFCNGKYFSSVLFQDPMDKRESFIYLPLTNRDNKIGVFTVQSFNKNAYNSYHQGLMRNLANYLTIAMQNAYAFQQIEKQNIEIIKTSNQLKEINDTLEFQVQNRTSEIIKQKEIIEAKNFELERLSLVARKTNNAIMIMDAKGNIQWVNNCFSRIYNYTYEEFIAKRGNNILMTSFNPDIKRYFEKCISSKKAVYYDALNITLDGKEIWTQTTLTPVLNADDEITHLLTIDSDITRRKQYELMLTRQSQDITNSILYAKRIQTAILPPIEWFDFYLEKYFLIYKPKDIVSGDFYWISKKKNKILLAIADCTGHGVPGAFMSMLGISILNEIILSYEVTNSSDLLVLLRDKIKSSLRQTHKNLGMADGMDISLCLIDKENNILEFSGAYNSLLHVRDGSIFEYKGDKMPIGIYLNDDVPFSRTRINLQKGDRFYITTDGYIDQFGGVKDSKFMMRRFKELIAGSQDLSIFDQKKAFENTFEKWVGKNNPQIDDVCVIGYEV